MIRKWLNHTRKVFELMFYTCCYTDDNTELYDVNTVEEYYGMRCTPIEIIQPAFTQQIGPYSLVYYSTSRGHTDPLSPFKGPFQANEKLIDIQKHGKARNIHVKYTRLP